jgi:DNA-binding CsgD family transcriptional regulator
VVSGTRGTAPRPGPLLAGGSAALGPGRPHRAGASRRADRYPGELTATERRIAELAASGLSNQEVAERAFLTVKGVEANLTRAYRKLGIRSRGGLAGALRRDDEPVT